MCGREALILVLYSLDKAALGNPETSEKTVKSGDRIAFHGKRASFVSAGADFIIYRSVP